MMALEGSAGQEEALFHRKIEFHLARKQFNGFGNISDNEFKLVTLNPKAAEPINASRSANKSERTELLETRLDPELSFRITYRRIGAGLRNLGNTCFLNSVLQCLTYTEPLAAYLQSGKHQNSCRAAGFCALCAIQKHVSRALQSTGRILEPKDLVSNLRCISRNFRNARQEDAHEYMVNLLESMHRCCLPSGVSSESPSAYEKSLVHKIFGGRLRSQVKCTQCSYCSNKFDPFLDLSLEINKADSLYKALAHFTAKEQLDGGAKQYQCQQCKQKVRALKQLSVYKAPNVLAIHLKRFGSHSPGQKIDKNVSFGPNLDLKPFVTGPYDGDLKYTLYGVLVHAGWSTHSGHYYCFVRTSSGMWYTLDDNRVFQVSEKKVLEQKAYMLFYVRDGGNFVAKKPVDINHKESMVANATAHTKLNPELRVQNQNGTVERKMEVSNASLSEKGVLPITTAPKEITLKKIPSENGNVTVFVDSSDLKRDPLSEPSLVMPLVKDSGNSSSLTINSVGKQAESSLTTEASGTVVISGYDAKIVDCNNRVSDAQDMNTDNKANKDQNKSADNPPFSSGLCMASGEVRDIGGSNSELPKGMAVHLGAIEEASNNIDSSKSSKKRSIEYLSPDKPTTSEQLSVKNKRPKLKMKRKLFMHQVSSMPLSSNIIFGAALCLQKKQKRRKSHSLQNKSSIMRLKNEKADLVSIDKCTQSQKAKENCSSYDGDRSEHNASGNGVISGDAINNELKQRLKTDSTVVLSKKPEREPVYNGPDSSGNLLRESKQNNIMSLLMRGLEETTVARWDGIDVSLSEKAELGRVESERIIGHVGDEWDDEYDRGKRRKIKSSKISFEGPNLFQAIASRNNTQRKRPKLH